MDIRPQSHEIIRTWAFYTIVKSLHYHDKIPWKDVMISGHVLMGERAYRRYEALTQLYADSKYQELLKAVREQAAPESGPTPERAETELDYAGAPS